MRSEKIGRGSLMPKISMLYHTFQMKKTYEDIHEEKILSSLYSYKTGTLDVVVSRIINIAVLEHMNLSIDSTIMQMSALNEYLSQLFMSNFEVLMYNYALHYLEDKGIEEIEEEMVEKLERLSKQIDIKTELEGIILKLDTLCGVIS